MHVAVANRMSQGTESPLGIYMWRVYRHSAQRLWSVQEHSSGKWKQACQVTDKAVASRLADAAPAADVAALICARVVEQLAHAQDFDREAIRLMKTHTFDAVIADVRERGWPLTEAPH
mgnify:CR=1 FL=1